MCFSFLALSFFLPLLSFSGIFRVLGGILEVPRKIQNQFWGCRPFLAPSVFLGVNIQRGSSKIDGTSFNFRRNWQHHKSNKNQFQFHKINFGVVQAPQKPVSNSQNRQHHKIEQKPKNWREAWLEWFKQQPPERQLWSASTDLNAGDQSTVEADFKHRHGGSSGTCMVTTVEDELLRWGQGFRANSEWEVHSVAKFASGIPFLASLSSFFWLVQPFSSKFHEIIVGKLSGQFLGVLEGHKNITSAI